MRRKKGKSIIKKTTKSLIYKGIKFNSYLEIHMYKLLEKAKLDFTYNERSYEIVEGFHFGLESIERQANGKGDFKDRGNSKVRAITYKPDFIVGDEDFIIETKGWANDTFPIRWKLFKKFLHDSRSEATLMKPHTKNECEECLNIILEFYGKRK